MAVLALGAWAAAAGAQDRAASSGDRPLALVERDARSAGWSIVRREALLAGRFPPPYLPVSSSELDELLAGGRVDRRVDHGSEPGIWRREGCPCSGRPLHGRLGGRVVFAELGPGDLLEGEAGLGGRGAIVALEPDLALARGGLWLALTPRLDGPLAPGGSRAPGAPDYAGWPVASGRPAAGAARREPTDWRLSLVRAVLGARFGDWALTAGLQPAGVGAGLDGDGLTLGSQAERWPQVVLRRTRPLRWSGPIRFLAPRHLLVRAGWTSAQTLRYRTEWGLQERRATPLFSQWLLTWHHAPWWRTTVTHAALAAPRRGESLWADLPQINAPLLGATWSERDHGPVTDRLFSLTMEWRFREAPWPVLPRAAGRLWWEYGGEDYRPHDVLPLVPEIAAPATLAGIELVDRRWDLGLQYLRTRHPRVLWYSNGGFDAGYAHRRVVLGHPLGGGAEAVTVLVRLRPGGRGELELRGRTASWRDAPGLPAEAERREISVGWRRVGTTGDVVWSIAVGWVGEEAGRARDGWWTVRAERRF